jgi:hypothetical protein
VRFWPTRFRRSSGRQRSRFPKLDAAREAGAQGPAVPYLRLGARRALARRAFRCATFLMQRAHGNGGREKRDMMVGGARTARVVLEQIAPLSAGVFVATFRCDAPARCGPFADARRIVPATQADGWGRERRIQSPCG